MLHGPLMLDNMLFNAHLYFLPILILDRYPNQLWRKLQLQWKQKKRKEKSICGIKQTSVAFHKYSSIQVDSSNTCNLQFQQHLCLFDLPSKTLLWKKSHSHIFILATFNGTENLVTKRVLICFFHHEKSEENQNWTI